ncbi:Ribosomal RNA small subunit methyltransferase I [compost metagenome]
MKDFPDCLIFFESPHRVQKFLADAYQVFGARDIAIAREMTKKFEEVYRGPLLAQISDYPLRSWKGEFVLVIPGSTPAKKAKKP